ncbi:MULTISPECIES: GNAT family N-acetyltransferase [unclassified Streptomyces]|uniref:GNAT family N-acetyltransferase n=1 Tax=unclassified Streptomyces TaxID=2593676 RepID=UPI001660CE17|nr:MULTISPECIES: GNAT family N-acetyltransferase [unclassified Streptomyces]MBD0709262.1 siderophore biosynthesis protein [Streptomyces sp. CBMA291]MBD0713593.1 siderophore biosynthesis protein [Streptomyces sp. CBMA370]
MTTAAYVQHIEGFGTVTVRPVDPDRDAPLLHGWVNEERSRFWGMVGTTVEEVREVYAHLDSLTTHHGFLISKDEVPVALFQTYDPEADRVGECYEVLPGDIGVHLLIAPGPAPLPGWTGRLLDVLITFALRDRARIVVDPDAANEKAIARMVRAGFTLGPLVVLPEVDLPEVFIPAKKAQLAFLPKA